MDVKRIVFTEIFTIPDAFKQIGLGKILSGYCRRSSSIRYSLAVRESSASFIKAVFFPRPTTAHRSAAAAQVLRSTRRAADCFQYGPAPPPDQKAWSHSHRRRAQKVDFIAGGSFGGNDDDGNGPAGAYVRQYLITAAVGQHEIKKNQIRPVFLQNLRNMQPII